MHTLLRKCLLGLFCCPVAAVAQQSVYTYVESSHVKVYSGTTQRSTPWMGGVTSPQFAMADLNKDGKADLVLYEKFVNNQIKTFLNTGTSGSPSYVYAPKYAKNFPAISSYLKLEDYNCDGIPDLFHRGMAGIAVWRGYYNASNELAFTYYKELYYPRYKADGSLQDSLNAYIEATDVPAFVDVDRDGDLDFFGFAINGSVIYWYRNYQVENHLPCDSIHVRLRSMCWGKTQQGVIRKAAMAYSCGIDTLSAPAAPDGAPEGDAPAGASAKTTLHGGNTLCFLDYDGDGDYDYLNGNYAFNDVQLLRNGKIEYGGRDSIISQDTLWPSNNLRYDMPSFPAAYHLDYDGDGKRDLLITTHAGPGSKDWNNIWWYRNTGTDAAPQFQFVKDSLLLDNSIDAGSYSHPVFYDFDKDGKLDLIIGSAGYFQSATGTSLGRLQYYRNTSTPGNPQFQFVTDNLANVAASNAQGAIPAFGDVDGDGKDDMIVGRNDGTVSYYRNTATTGVTQPQWVLQDLMLKNDTGGVINAIAGASPVLYDVDKDGKKDLILGGSRGRLMCYLNKGTSLGVVSFKHLTDSIGLARVDPQSFLSAYSAPFIGKIDSTGKDYLLMGSNSGALYLYDGVTGGTTTSYTLVSNAYAGIKPGSRTAPAVADVDGDGSFEMLVGNQNGGLFLYRSGITTSINGPATNTLALDVFPNPAAGSVDVRWNRLQAGAAELAVHDLTGRLVLSVAVPAAAGGYTVPVADWNNGLYFVTVQNGSNRTTARFSVLH